MVDFSLPRFEHSGVLVDHLSFPESLRWHESELWFSDFYLKTVFKILPGSSLQSVVKLPQQPSGLGWLPNGDLIIVSMLDKKLMRMNDDGVSIYADLSGFVDAPCNDMLVSASGNAYIGNFGFNKYAGEPFRSTKLLKVDLRGDISEAANNVHFPNGCAISLDEEYLYLAESYANRISIFKIKKDGALDERKTFYSDPGFFPDGLCMDLSGNIWVCDPVSKWVIQIDRDGRRIIEFALPQGRLPISCVFDGQHSDRLYVASTTVMGPEAETALTGRIEIFDLAIERVT